MKLVALTKGKVLYRHDAATKEVYFPRAGVVSIQRVLNNGDTGEVAIVGNEGFVGVSLLVVSQSLPTRAVVQSPGEAWALPAATMTTEFRQGGVFQTLVLHYIQALMAQMAQATMCTRRHRVEQQISRWLLGAFDRTNDGDLRVTHEAIADSLGVRREGVTEALGRLQQQSGIKCGRGRIQLRDRAALEACSCECYGVVRDEYRRLLGTHPTLTTSSPSLLGGRASGSQGIAGDHQPHQAPCVLVVEDEMYPALQLEDQLSEAGYRVLKAARLPAALELAESAQIDAAILDINLSGTEVFPAAAVLRKRGIPFLFASAYDRNRLPPAFGESPMLQKPYVQHLLQRELWKLLQRGADAAS